MHVLLTGNTTFKIVNFRRGLIRRLLDDGHKVTVIAPPDEYAEKANSLGFDFVPLQMNRNGISPIGELFLLYSMLTKIVSIRPDVVFSYTIKNNIYGGIICRFLGIPFVPNVTGLGPAFNAEDLINRLVRLLYRFSLSKAQVAFFQNANDLAIFTDSGLVSKSRVRLLPGSGVDLNYFSACALPESSDCIRFLLVARLLWDKGIGIYASAARKVRKNYPQARFQLLGPLDPDSRSGIKEADLNEWIAEGVVDYLGSTQDVRKYLRSAHCVVLPSYYREGTPRSLLEAGAVGRPVITTDMPGCRDVVIDNETGFLVSPRDVDQLAAACEKFIKMSAARKATMGAASRRHTARYYDEKIVIDAYIEVLARLTCP